MRPVIVKFLNEVFKTNVFNWLVPELAVLYSGTIFICLLIFVRRVKLKGLSEYHAWGVGIFSCLAGIIGVRLWYLLLNIDIVFQQPSVLLELQLFILNIMTKSSCF